ncbi:MAG TPA: GDP-mannose 4,6-dehydratase [Solirubrobacteraceae bacterium]|nr:GDP-mannose 4,6-dehydratase [Solirubrobacteraceae bacterium]
MRFLITGGAGFVGSHLAEELLERGHTVHVLDDLSTGSMANIAHLRSGPRFEYTIDSADDDRVVAEVVDSADAVYHLAAAVGVELIVESPVSTIETNVHCTEVVLSHAAKKRKPLFVASTSEVYGKSTQLPFREDGDLLIGPTTLGRWAYACSKAIDEFLAIAYWRERRLPTVVGRLFNTVGPRQTGRYGMVIPRFVRQALAEQPITVHGDGSQRRCFLHVADAVQALADLMGNEEHYGEVFNIGSTEEISIAELAERVRARTGSTSSIQLLPYEEAYGAGFEDMMRRVPDVGKIERAIGWRAGHSLDQILDSVIEHQRHTGES